MFAIVIIACLVAWYFIKSSGSGTMAVIYVDGEEYDRIDLSRVKESYSFDIDTEYGHNTVTVDPGAISVTEADCPDKVCVNQGKISTGGVPVVCMPHRLYIMIEGGDIDG